MKNFDLLKAITLIDDKYVEDALNYRSGRKTLYKQITVFTSVAACICLVILGAVFVSHYFNDTPNPPIDEPKSDFVIENGTLVAYTGNETEITLPDEVITIGSNAFSGAENASGITTITLNSDIKNIDEKAFEGVSALNKINIPESNDNFIFTDGVLMATDGSINFSLSPEGDIDVNKFIDTIRIMENNVDFIGKRTTFVFGELTIVAQNFISDHDKNDTYFVIETFSVFGQTFNLYDSKYDSSFSSGLIGDDVKYALLLTDEVFLYSKTAGDVGYYLIITENNVYEYEDTKVILPDSEEARNNPTWYNDWVHRYYIDDADRLCYISQPRKYLENESIYEQLRYCVALDELAWEEGYVTFENGSPVHNFEKSYTAGEIYDVDGIFNSWYNWVSTDESVTDEYYTSNSIPKVTTLDELLYYNSRRYVKVFNLYDDLNLPLRLIDMTYAEIEAEFGPLEYPYMMYGGSPVYTSERLPGINIVYISADATLTDGRPAAASDETPDRIDVVDGEYYMYPGIYIGMPVEELVWLLGDYTVTDVSPMMKDTYDITATINGTYSFSGAFKLTDEMYYGFLDYYHSVKNEIDPQYGYSQLVEQLKDELKQKLNGELLGYNIYR